MIDELFQSPVNLYLDPRLRDWAERLAEPGVGAHLSVDWPPFIVGRTSAAMTILLGSENDSPETMLWDDDLNAILVEKQVRAVDQDQEATRFSLSLRSSFKRAERDFGDGYFNSVFFAVLRELELAAHPDLQPLVSDLDYLHNIDNPQSSERYRICHDMIKLAIQAKANDLTKSLKYELEPAKKILVAALVDFIDRRFSVSIRRQRGLL